MYCLLQELHIAEDKGVEELIILGDPLITI